MPESLLEPELVPVEPELRELEPVPELVPVPAPEVPELLP